ncbi:hypothetical protein ACP0AK_04795 [Listeria ivanovii]|uniref:Uncharacterized protein n=1 Tax=Listeria ivanovii (strain ATCC BAA-678 / PAM 55) TaxID=881621 RepID=G2ZDC1_LISIP|nr:hypothetical protein [Listeria ivanovii]AHI55318.1 hypothetical protein AX25_04125 [Listeria ivanovii WSLC3009]AIS64777.1 hypothetical protein JL52_04050 [Listeria ivanovii subsp. ivanovii]MBC1758519.1 hypothetical protein [Listeria ivanovii]MBK3913394.1 hypothetical protein [Listeria ivanovii subsp. ivanovii]MBK3920488.1 hypothetical protein [Listeria ivanovii subsp. ivanovii]
MIKERKIVLITSLFFIALTFLGLLFQREIIWNIVSGHFDFSVSNIINLLAGKDLVTFFLHQVVAALKGTVIFIIIELLFVIAISVFIIIVMFRAKKKEGWTKTSIAITSGYSLLLLSLVSFLILFSVQSLHTYQNVHDNVVTAKKTILTHNSQEVEDSLANIMDDPKKTIQKIKGVSKQLDEHTGVFTLLSEWLEKVKNAENMLFIGVMIGFLLILLAHISELYRLWQKRQS